MASPRRPPGRSPSGGAATLPLIPRIIHQIWVGPDPLPSEQRPWIQSWRRHHPTWEHRLWTEENLPEDPIRPEVLERLRAPVERADILRLEVLFRHGGVYVDTDLECLRSLEEALGDEEFVGVCLKPGRVTNTLIASVPGHPILERALRELRPMDVYWTLTAESSLKDAAGPPLLRSLVRDFPDVKLLPPAACFPATTEERERALAVHHRARSWHNLAATRTAMLEAERRLGAAKTELEGEKRRHAATRKRLERIEERLGRDAAGRRGLRSRLGRLRRSG